MQSQSLPNGSTGQLVFSYTKFCSKVWDEIKDLCTLRIRSMTHEPKGAGIAHFRPRAP